MLFNRMQDVQVCVLTKSNHYKQPCRVQTDWYGRQVKQELPQCGGLGLSGDQHEPPH